MAMLTANGLNANEYRSFVTGDVDAIFERQVFSLRKFVITMTDAGNGTNRLIGKWI